MAFAWFLPPALFGDLHGFAVFLGCVWMNLPSMGLP